MTLRLLRSILMHNACCRCILNCFQTLMWISHKYLNQQNYCISCMSLFLNVSVDIHRPRLIPIHLFIYLFIYLFFLHNPIHCCRKGRRQNALTRASIFNRILAQLLYSKSNVLPLDAVYSSLAARCGYEFLYHP